MPPFTYCQNVGGTWEECASCTCVAPLAPFSLGPPYDLHHTPAHPTTRLLCELCAGSLAGNASASPNYHSQERALLLGMAQMLNITLDILTGRHPDNRGA